MYPVYCHMSNLSAKCGGGGWTLVMKLDGDEVKHVIYIKQEKLLLMQFRKNLTQLILIIYINCY